MANCDNWHSVSRLSLPYLRLRSHRHDTSPGFCLRLAEASPIWVERSRSLVQVHNSTCVSHIKNFQWSRIEEMLHH